MHIPAPDWVSFDANKTQGLDLLGLRAPVQALSNHSLNGLTSVTPKLRYLSVLTWIIWRYAECRLPANRSDFIRFAAAQEAAIVMANLVHDRTTLALVGVGKARAYVDSGRRTLPLEALVQNIAFNIYTSASLQLHLTFEETATGLLGLSKERGLPLARAFDRIVGATQYGARLANRRVFGRVPRADIEQLGKRMCLDDFPEREKAILVDALFPVNPIDDAERRRITTLALLLWLAARKQAWIDQSDLFDAAREPPARVPNAFKTALDGWLDYQIRDVIAVTHEAVMDAVLGEVDSLSTPRRAPALASDVVAALLSAIDEHNDALRLIGLLEEAETINHISFAEVSDRVRRACQNLQTFEQGLRRWRGGLSEHQLCEAALGSGAAAAALLPIAWCLGAYRVSPEHRQGHRFRDVANIGGFFQIGLLAVIIPKLDEFIRDESTYLQVMSELIVRTVQQHLRVTWQRLATQGQDVSVLVADLETWARNNVFRAGQTESRLGVAVGWLQQLDLIDEDGITINGQRVLDRALATLEVAAP